MKENFLTLNQEIAEFCAHNGEEWVVNKYARYFREGSNEYHAWGVPSEKLKMKSTELAAREDLTMEMILNCALSATAATRYEETSLLIAVAEKRLKTLEPQHLQGMGQWFAHGINNWALCDMLCNKVVPAFFLKRIVPLQELESWRNSPLRFQRRAVPVQTIKLLKSTSDYSCFLDLIEPLMTDNERVVHQGLGWFLREAWKKQPQQIASFLLKWKDNSARLIIQYATEKMTSEEKLKYKRSKPS
ncbi:MAG: DNA alkylation repair protein [Marinilabiliales bacterium]|nr:DNA alkylation repair protein [Marinilabiliales bacterium]